MRRRDALRPPARTACLPARPVNTQPSVEALRLEGVLGGEVWFIFLLTYFYFNALENPQTFLFYRHTFPAALSLLTIRQRQSSRVVGSGLSSARIFQGFCTSMLCGQRSCLSPRSSEGCCCCGCLRVERIEAASVPQRYQRHCGRGPGTATPSRGSGRRLYI